MNRAKFDAEREQKFLAYIGIEYPYRQPKNTWHPTPVKGKILCLADLHEPYASGDVLKDAREKHHDASVVVIPGDIGDFYSKSRFKKTRHVSFKDELHSVFVRMEWLSCHWRDVRIMLGNHDNRPEKMLIGNQENSVDLLILTEQDLLGRLASYFDNVEIVGHRVSSEINLTHIYQLGDIVFTHAEVSREQDSAILGRTSDYLHRWAKTLKLSPYSIIAQAHNHREARMHVDGEGWFLLPTAAETFTIGMEYIFSSRIQGKPPQRGYTVFYQTNGRTDYNRSHNYLVGL